MLRLRKQNRFMNLKNSKPNTIKRHDAGEQKKQNLCHFVTLEIFVYVLWTQSASSLRSHELEKRFEFNETSRKAPRLDPIMSFRKPQTRLSNGLGASSELYEEIYNNLINRIRFPTISIISKTNLNLQFLLRDFE